VIYNDAELRSHDGLIGKKKDAFFAPHLQCIVRAIWWNVCPDTERALRRLIPPTLPLPVKPEAEVNIKTGRSL